MGKEESEDNSVFIGDKSPMQYIYSISVQAANKIEEIVLRARGRAISKACDVSQIAVNKSMKDWEVKEVKIGTHEKEVEGKIKPMTYINITIAKKKESQ